MLFRGLSSLSYGAFEKTVFTLSVPYDIRNIGVQYTTLDGKPYTPPYGDIHHRNETLYGLSDPTLVGKYYLFSEHGNLFDIQLGTTIPLGKTVEDPYKLGEQGQTHQHIQFGTGTFVPMLGAEVIYNNIIGWAQSSLSLYNNNKGFKPGWNFSAGGGPSIKISDSVSILPQLEFFYQAPNIWSNVPEEDSQRLQIAGSASLVWQINPTLSLNSQVKIPIYRRVIEHNGDIFNEPFVINIGITKIFEKDKEEE